MASAVVQAAQRLAAARGDLSDQELAVLFDLADLHLKTVIDLTTAAWQNRLDAAEKTFIIQIRTEITALSGTRFSTKAFFLRQAQAAMQIV